MSITNVEMLMAQKAHPLAHFWPSTHTFVAFGPNLPFHGSAWAEKSEEINVYESVAGVV